MTTPMTERRLLTVEAFEGRLWRHEIHMWQQMRELFHQLYMGDAISDRVLHRVQQFVDARIAESAEWNLDE
jgi:hypothetical protein